MKTTPRTEADAVSTSNRSLLSEGWHNANIVQAVEKASKRGNDMIELTLSVKRNGSSSEFTLRDWLTDTEASAAKLRHIAEAAGAMEKYEAGEIGAADLTGPVRIKVSIQKRRGYPESNKVDDYARSR